MNTSLKTLIALMAVAMATQAAAQVTFYEEDHFRGRSFSAEGQVRSITREGFIDSAASAEVIGPRWEVCENPRFGGPCKVLRAGRYPTLDAMGLNHRVSSARSIAPTARIDDRRYAPTELAGQVTFYEQEGFRGQSFTSDGPIENLQRQNFNDRASSVVVHAGLWEVCEDAAFRGRCFVLRPGQYPSLSSMGLNDRVSSLRLMDGTARLDDNRYAPAPAVTADYQRRNNERLYEANVVSVRAVVGPPQQRCWLEKEQVAKDPGKNNLPATIAGAVIGGILGHQVGGGAGKDLATVGGAVAGAAIGANAGRNRNPSAPATQDVQRCENIPNQAAPEYWDVTYTFKGKAHHVQMTSPPGATVTVNGQGEPRV